MHHMTPDDTPPAGLPGTIKLIAILFVLVLAILAVLMVLDVLPRSIFSDTAGKLIALAGIAAVTSVAIWAIAGRARDGDRK
jgi:hypothetical protein